MEKEQVMRIVGRRVTFLHHRASGTARVQQLRSFDDDLFCLRKYDFRLYFTADQVKYICEIECPRPGEAPIEIHIV